MYSKTFPNKMKTVRKSNMITKVNSVDSNTNSAKSSSISTPLCVSASHLGSKGYGSFMRIVFGAEKATEISLVSELCQLKMKPEENIQEFISRCDILNPVSARVIF